MIEGKGWFVRYFSGLCEDRSLEEIAEGVPKDARGRPVYSAGRFVDDLITAVWNGFDGAIHPVLGEIHIDYRIPPWDPQVREWSIACNSGEARFTFPLDRGGV